MPDQVDRTSVVEAGRGVAVPDLAALAPGRATVTTASHRVETTSFDTPSGHLAQAEVVLRRRAVDTVGSWQLQVLGEDLAVDVEDAGPGTTALPPAVARLLTGVAGGEAVVAVARSVTDRTVHRATDGRRSGADPDLLLQLVDDRVESVSLDGRSRRRVWRTLTVTEGPAGSRKLRRRTVDRLFAVGARPVEPESELQRVLGHAAGPAPLAGKSGTVGRLAAEYVRAQCREVVRCDVGLRLDEPLVHRFRVAVRRLRSTLRVFAPLFEAEAAAELEAELVWFAGLLGEVRDREVLLGRLARQLQDLPPEIVLGSVAAHIETTLLVEQAQHRSRVAEAMDGDRYQELVQTLRRWRTRPPLTDRAAKPVTNATRYVERAERTMNRRLAAADGDVEALHGARKAAKRYRYATELTAAVGGRRAGRVVRDTAELQALLGEHQDSVVSADFLRRMGAGASADNDQNGFTYGFLLAQELRRAQQLRDRAQRRFGAPRS